MNLSITLNFTSLEQAMRALSALPRDVVIAPEDDPSAGVDVRQVPLAFDTPPPAQPTAAQVFGGAVAPAAPPAPSTAAAAALPTAPVAPPAGLPLPPNAAQPPAPPLAPAAPVPAASAAPANPAGIEVDANGLPWDERIHAGGRAKNKDGTWRSKRGVNDAAKVKAIEAELRQALAAGLPQAVPQPPAPPAAPPQPPAPVAPPAPPAAPAAETFASLMVKIQTRKAGGSLSDDQVAATLAQLGLSALGQLATRPDLVPAVGAMVDAL